MTDKDYLFFILIGIGILLGYLIFGNTCQNSMTELNNLKIEYNKLNESYNKLNERNQILEEENRILRTQQRELGDEIASYLLEQSAIDLLGMRKYEMAYNLIKISLCNKNPTIPFC